MSGETQPRASAVRWQGDLRGHKIHHQSQILRLSTLECARQELSPVPHMKSLETSTGARGSLWEKRCRCRELASSVTGWKTRWGDSFPFLWPCYHQSSVQLSGYRVGMCNGGRNRGLTGKLESTNPSLWTVEMHSACRTACYWTAVCSVICDCPGQMHLLSSFSSS